MHYFIIYFEYCSCCICYLLANIVDAVIVLFLVVVVVFVAKLKILLLPIWQIHNDDAAFKKINSIAICIRK